MPENNTTRPEVTRTPYTPGARQAKAEIPTDEQRVKAVYSDARWACVDEGRRLWAILGKRIGHLWRQVQLCEGLAQDKEAHGWKVAASNLPTPLPAEGVALPELYSVLGPSANHDVIEEVAGHLKCQARDLFAQAAAGGYSGLTLRYAAAYHAALSDSAALRKQLEQAQQETAGLRKRIHHVERHNQWFSRCESAWCNPSDTLYGNPALEMLKGAVERALTAEAKLKENV